MPIKRFSCEYFQIVVENTIGREAIFDLERWIRSINIERYEDNLRGYKDDSVRIEEIHFHETYGTWFLRFLRIREFDNPSLSSREAASRYMEIDGEYVSEDVTCLYDSQNSVLMIQKNSHSVTPLGIEAYLNSIWEGEEIIRLRRIISTDSFERARRSERSRSIRVRIADFPTVRDEGILANFQSSIKQALEAMSGYNIPYIDLTFSMGKYTGRDTDLGENLLDSILDDVQNNPTAFDRAEVKIIEEGEIKTEFINLFLDVVKDTIEFEVARAEPLRFDVMMERLAGKYCPGGDRENRKALIDRLLL
ncbi:MAG: DUF6731 family protein [Cetobacterium sp.]